MGQVCCATSKEQLEMDSSVMGDSKIPISSKKKRVQKQFAITCSILDRSLKEQKAQVRAF